MIAIYTILRNAGIAAVVTPIERPTLPVAEADSNAAMLSGNPASKPASVPIENVATYKITINAALLTVVSVNTMSRMW